MEPHRLRLHPVLIPVSLASWAVRHGVTAQAFAELRVILAADLPAPPPPPANAAEGYSQAQIRLEAAQKGVRLFRNNVGVLKDETGRPVRFGLANDSAEVNRRIKSSDLIGWRRLLIVPEMVGTVVAQFVARECKRPGWKYSGDARELAQERFLHLAATDGADAAFANGPGSL